METLNKLAEFYYSEPSCADFLDMAVETFWEDILDKTYIEDPTEIREVLDSETWSLIQINLTAFFASNDYQQHPDPAAPRWNLVECFLAANTDKLSADEFTYAQALRQSHMSIYRIIGAEAQGRLKLWDMIDAVNVTAQIDSETIGPFIPKSIWGLRLLDHANGPIVMSGALPLKETSAKRVAAEMKKIHVHLMRQVKSPDMRTELGGTPAEKIEHLARVLWAPEIATSYMLGCLVNSSSRQVQE